MKEGGNTEKQIIAIENHVMHIGCNLDFFVKYKTMMEMTLEEEEKHWSLDQHE